MSHEIKIHEAQTSILRELLFLPTAGFAELQKPKGLTSDHFTFHIGRLVELGLVEKSSHGKYGLTTLGKEYANRLDTDERKVERQGKIAVLVVPMRTRPDGVREYMVQKRLKHPYYGFHGFMTGKLRWGETVLIGAARELEEETGLRGDLEVRGVCHKIDYTKDGMLLEDKHFYMVEATNLEGDFMAKFDGGENYWHTMEEVLTLRPIFVSMDEVAEAVLRKGQSFIEMACDYEPEEY